MLELALELARNDETITPSVLRLIRANLHVDAHDFPYAVWLTCLGRAASLNGFFAVVWSSHWHACPSRLRASSIWPRR
jgi:hypothetical protein